MSHQALKGSDLSIGLWKGESGHSFWVLLAGLHTFLWNVVSQVIDLVLKEFTLCWHELQVVLPEAFEHNVQVM